MQKESEAKEKEQQQAARALQQIEAVSSHIRIFSYYYHGVIQYPLVVCI